MFRLCAFADEISPDLDEQIRVCRECGVTHLELRSADKSNVLEFSDPSRARLALLNDVSHYSAAAL